MAESRASAANSSNNPFRRKSTPAPDVVTSTIVDTVDGVFETRSDVPDARLQQPTTSGFFRQQLQALPQTNTPPPSTTFQKPKVVKKVRVQSPPPSSPESAGAPHAYPTYGYRDESSESSSDDDGQPEDPVWSVPPPLGVMSRANYSVPTAATTLSGAPPPNPFAKTLEDIEHASTETPTLQGGPVTGKGPLDVDAFKRLLMTGQAATPGVVPSLAVSNPGSSSALVQAADAASITDASSVSRHSIFDTATAQETPRTSHDISEAEGDEDRLGLVRNSQAKTQQTTSTLRKKPPPPSSRHGKLIKGDLSKVGDDDKPTFGNVTRLSASPSRPLLPSSPGSSSSTQQPSTPSDVNKPLPPAPARRSIDEVSESIFDREAAGKVPESVEREPDIDLVPTPHLPTPPNASQVAATGITSSPRQPPPPPKRRAHARIDSTPAVATDASVPATPSFTEEPSMMRRASQDSTRSRTSSLRVNIHAPAPPPPRRPNHASRPSLTASSPAVSFAGVAPTTASPSTSPAPSDPEPAGPHSPVPLVASPEPTSTNPGTTSLYQIPVSPPLTAPSPGTSKPRMAPPPLPPARNASVRSAAGRPSSLRSVDAPARRVKEKDGSTPTAPPPPPPPKRSRAGSGRHGGALLRGPVTEEPVPSSTASDASVGGTRLDEKSADDILADLTALQREVDALRGQYEKKPASSGL